MCVELGPCFPLHFFLNTTCLCTLTWPSDDGPRSCRTQPALCEREPGDRCRLPFHDSSMESTASFFTLCLDLPESTCSSVFRVCSVVPCSSRGCPFSRVRFSPLDTHRWPREMVRSPVLSLLTCTVRHSSREEHRFWNQADWVQICFCHLLAM